MNKDQELKLKELEAGYTPEQVKVLLYANRVIRDNDYFTAHESISDTDRIYRKGQTMAMLDIIELIKFSGDMYD